jgi:hypothetical protein
MVTGAACKLPATSKRETATSLCIFYLPSCI